MTSVKEMEADAKAVIAETESVVSAALEAATPRWTRLKAAWQSWTLQKREIAVFVGIIGLVVAWHFGMDITRLVVGNYRASYAYGHGYQLTKSDMDSALKTANASQAEIDDLTATVNQMKIELHAVEDKMSEKKPAKITTGSIKRRRK